MGETDVHIWQLINLLSALKRHFADRPEVWVGGDLLLFHEAGNRRKHRCPDVFVAFGLPTPPRGHYLLWEQGKAPDVIFEITSRSTRYEDLRVKKALYARIGVTEYYVFDPLREYLKPSLRAWRLHGGRYLPVTGSPIVSPALGLELRIVDDELRLWDPMRESLLEKVSETSVALQQERSRREQAEARVRELEAEIRRPRSQ